jgi:hypothetical protein
MTAPGIIHSSCAAFGSKTYLEYHAMGIVSIGAVVRQVATVVDCP